LLNKEKTEVKFSFEVTAEVLEKGMAFAYNKHKNQISLPGFRKGKVPRKLIESQYGEGFFYEDAVNHIFPEEYMAAVKELNLDVVSAPSLDVEYIGSDKGAKFIVDVTIKPELKLGQYKGLSTEKVVSEVTEEEVLAELEKVQAKNARTVEVTDRAAEMGDVVKMSYEGSVDGVPFEGGKADEHDLELGSGMFIPGFEEKLVGHALGEKFDIDVKFPEEYHSPDLAGKDAVFAIEIKGITKKNCLRWMMLLQRTFPNFPLWMNTKQAFWKSLAKEKEKKQNRFRAISFWMWQLQTAKWKYHRLCMITKLTSMMKDFEDNIVRQGLSLDIYCQYMGTTPEEMKENFKETKRKECGCKINAGSHCKGRGLSSF